VIRFRTAACFLGPGGFMRQLRRIRVRGLGKPDGEGYGAWVAQAVWPLDLDDAEVRISKLMSRTFAPTRGWMR